MHLVDYIDGVLADLRRYLNLLHQSLDVIDSVVGGGIKFVYAVRTSLIEGNAGFALTARFHIRGGMLAVDGFGKDTRRTGLADSSRTAEQIRMRQLVPEDGILEGFCNIVLTYKRFE